MLCFTGVPPQSHFKVISRSLQGHTKENMIFLIFYRFQTQLGCRWVLHMTAVDTLLVGYHYTTHRKRIVCNFSLGVITPLVFPLSHPFFKVGVNQQNYWHVAVWNYSLSPHDNIWIHNWVWWSGVVLYLGYHPKVTSRSSQGHCKGKLKQTCFFLPTPNPFEVQVSITNDCCWHNIARVPFYHASQVGHMQFYPWGWSPPWYSF